MTTKNNSCYRGRVIFTFLLLLGIFYIWAIPAAANDVDCKTRCERPDELKIELNEGEKCPVVPDFCACPTRGCDSLLVYFTDWSIGNITAWSWDFGDPASGAENYSTLTNPTHMYRSPGIYSVTLTVYSPDSPAGFEKITKDHLVIINTGPTADFDYTVTPGCDSTLVEFSDMSTGADTWYWNFGDGTVSTEQNPSHYYTAPGTYQVLLQVANECGLDRIKKTVEITMSESPTADFEANVTETCQDNEVIFTDLSTGADSWLWDFGDGTTSTDQNPVHTYNTPGNFTVSLTVANDCGEDTEIKEVYITIHPLPVADFTSDGSEFCGTGTVNFTDLSQYADTWSWDFGDGTTSTDQNPSHTYGKTGLYTVTLTVSNDCGDDTEIKSDYIMIAEEPTADFSSSAGIICLGETVEFYDHSSYASTWLWDFGDGTTSSDQNPTHTYRQSGLYDVSLTVTNVCGDDYKQEIEYVYVKPLPKADFSMDSDESCEEVTYTFTDKSEYATGWHWNFGNGETSNEVNPTAVYTHSGFYTITLIATNDCGADTVSKEIDVYIMETPVADFEADFPYGCIGVPIDFTNKSLYATSYEWDFGDGSTSTSENPSHSYAASGFYTVSLKAINKCGDDTETKIDYIWIAPDPVAGFDASPTEGCAPLIVNFTDKSTDAIYWIYEFGDGDDSSDPNPSHTYNNPGTYTVKMYAANDCKTDGPLEKTITVYGPPIADYKSDHNTVCVDQPVKFTDMSQDADTWEWDFGDGATSDLQNPEHSYSAPGYYDVSLIVRNDCGGDSEFRSQFIHVVEDPIADFSATEVEICQGETVGFINHSVNGTDYEWHFGDGTTSSQENPGHAYSTPGDFTVTLITSNACGADTLSKELYIHVDPLPIADFTAEHYDECVNTPVYFTNTSQYADSYLWDFGDGTTSTDTDPVHTYTSTGKYTITLTASNYCGDDTETKTESIYIYDLPVADFSISDDVICVNQTTSFYDKSINAISYDWNFGDGTTSQVPEPTHAYAAAGTYTVRLTVHNRCGDDTEIKENVITVDPLPVADFTADDTVGCVGTTIQFTDLSTDATGWSWNFGDGGTTTDQNPSHTYTSAGVYTVTLVASNDCGFDDEVKHEYIHIYDGPEVDFTFESVVGCNGENVTFTDHSLRATSWLWSFGDGATSTNQNPTHLYATPGTYSVKLVVDGECGSDSTTKDITTSISPLPVADFNTETNSGCFNTDFYFFDQSTNATSWHWDFGDGDTSIVQNPVHKYSNAGVYTVTLTVSNDCGSDSETKTDYITVYGGPTADFVGTPTSGKEPLTVTFTDLSTSPTGITSWSWDFGDGGTSSDQNPSHDYTAAGLYTVKLAVTDMCGPDTAVKTEYIYVDESCKIDFTGEPTEGCAELTVYFSSRAIGPCEVSSWTWDFGDPSSGSDNTANGPAPRHTYKNPGIYTVSLTAEDSSRTQVITKTDYVTVYGGPSAAISATPTSGSFPLYVEFTDHSTGLFGNVTWEWDFGDGATSTDQNPNHTYNTTGTYDVSMIVTTDCGVDTAYTQIEVIGDLVITKQVDKPVALLGDSLLYTLSITNGGEFAIYDISVMDSIPDSTAYVNGSITGAGTYISNQDLVRWYIYMIDPGQTIDLTFKVEIDGPITQVPTIISNTAYAGFNQEPAKVADDWTYRSNTVQTVVDQSTGTISISKDVSAALALPGDALTYTITVTNSNPTPALDVQIFDAIPDSTTYIAGSITGGGTYDPVTDSLYWNIGTLGAGGSVSVSFQVNIDNDVANGQVIPNTALVTTSNHGGSESNQVKTAVSLTPLVVTKKVNRPSAQIGDLLRYTVTVENFSGQPFTDVIMNDTMPSGIVYVDNSDRVKGGTTNTLSTNGNAYEWLLGSLPAGEKITVEYMAMVGTSASSGPNINVARASGSQGGASANSNRAIAQVFVYGQTLHGSIRGKVIVDCDGDGIPDMDTFPTGMDVYLDDGSQSRVNEKGMFYFSTVRPGERVVMLDERDLDGYYIPEGAQSSVFAHVHETGESYIIFRVCPEYPQLNIHKTASIIPTVKVVKKAKLNPDPITDSLGIMVDYEIDIKSNGLSDPTRIRVVDSMPYNTNLLIKEQQPLTPKKEGNELIYEVTAAQERLKKSVYYSLRDLTPGVRRYLTNKVHLEGDLQKESGVSESTSSEPAEVAVGPLQLAPAHDVSITLTPALFITSKADLQETAIPHLEAVADSIDKYEDADIKVEGHTDYRPIHNEEFPSNWELGEARAKAVVDWLVDNRGIARDRLAYESFAATRPVVLKGTTSEELQPNRRTEVIIRAKMPGFFNAGVLPTDEWMSATSMALNPNRFDTLFEAVETPIETGLDDSWEVALTVENTSEIEAENAVLTDILPDGVEYIANSATIDGRSVTVKIDGQTLSLILDKIAASQTIELRYRVRAIDETMPSGGGAASVEIMSTNDLPVIQKSNEVRFK